MVNRRLRLLYLGSAFPPGVSGETYSTASTYLTTHFEAKLVEGLSQVADVSSVSMLPPMLWKMWDKPRDNTPGLKLDLMLWDRYPALWHRWDSWRKLRRYYLDKVERDGMPDALIFRNLQHVYNYFIKWLKRQPRRPLIILLLGDSGGLGEKIPAFRRFRYKFKPLQMLEDEALLLYDACLVSGLKAKRYFEPRKVPWVWIPCGYNYHYDPPPPDPHQKGPIRFGYFGTLTDRSGIINLVHAFVASKVPGTLHVCGHGPMSEELARLSKLHPNFHFDGFLPKQYDCLPWAQKVDVLVNLRLPFWGQDNSAPSKVFDYGMAGKAILSTRTSGMDELLGQEGLYLETENFDESLRQKLVEVSAMDRAELQRRATIIRDRIVKDYSWEEQARRIAVFINTLKGRPSSS
ncbi:MAG TPA: glycosyltransferase [Verrucomicrobiae bacterium]|jgi:glycosyltransferase involved in cell wall biosynthesis